MFLRKATKTENFTELSRIFQIGWQHAYQGLVPQTYLDAIEATRWVPYFETDYKQMFVVESEQHQLLGAATYGPARDSACANWGEIKAIYVLPAHMGRGYGRQLLEACLRRLSRDYRHVYLWVLSENWPSRAFYEALGFTANGETKEQVIGGKTVTESCYVYHFLID